VKGWERRKRRKERAKVQGGRGEWESRSEGLTLRWVLQAAMSKTRFLINPSMYSLIPSMSNFCKSGLKVTRVQFSSLGMSLIKINSNFPKFERKQIFGENIFKIISAKRY
jgi:hypothetical protein